MNQFKAMPSTIGEEIKFLAHLTAKKVATYSELDYAGINDEIDLGIDDNGDEMSVIIDSEGCSWYLEPEEQLYYLSNREDESFNDML